MTIFLLCWLVSFVVFINVWLLIHTGKNIREDVRNGDL